MREPFQVSSDLDATVVQIRKPPALRHYQPLLVLTILALGAAIYLASAVVAGLAVCLLVAAMMVYRATPAEHHSVRLTASGLAVDGQAFDIRTVTMVLTDEKVVFRDETRQAELWHGIPRLRERMRLRELLEGSLADARRRQGDGLREVPADLRQGLELTSGPPRSS